MVLRPDERWATGKGQRRDVALRRDIMRMPFRRLIVRVRLVLPRIIRERELPRLRELVERRAERVADDERRRPWVRFPDRVVVAMVRLLSARMGVSSRRKGPVKEVRGLLARGFVRRAARHQDIRLLGLHDLTPLIRRRGREFNDPKVGF